MNTTYSSLIIDVIKHCTKFILAVCVSYFEQFLRYIFSYLYVGILHFAEVTVQKKISFVVFQLPCMSSPKNFLFLASLHKLAIPFREKGIVVFCLFCF